LVEPNAQVQCANMLQSMSAILTKLETYPELEGSIIRSTKIHKVLKAMLRLGSIPKDEEYHFKSRSADLLVKWNKILADDPDAAGADKEEADKSAAPAINGDNKAEAKDAEAPAADKDTATEETKAPADEKEAVKPTESEAPKAIQTPADPAATSAETDKPAEEATVEA
jgi:hypothetical protein